MAENSWMAVWYAKVTKLFAHTTAPTEEQQQHDSMQPYEEDKENSHRASVEDCSDEEGNENNREARLEDGSDEEDTKSGEDVPTEATDADAAARAGSSGINGTNGSLGKLWATARRAAVSKATELAVRAKDSVANAIKKTKELGAVGTAKAIGSWMKEHPWETAAIVTIIALACTGIGLSAVGFGTGGVAAGSIAAGLQAGIGNVVAGSLFATCTSAMMGGSGAVIIFGGIGIGTFATVGGGLAARRRWKSQRESALVKRSHTRTFSETSAKAMDDAIFWTICASAYVVYYMKSWWRGNAS
ncbi:hypothetical protein PtrSN002B_009322 [Pyrenophora tritici-repentis]|uniref:Ifi-6-16 multi-domain protein n=2 Tax=Pyrenophora tritici-repentis TaxID=45151 RepID=A0A2W1D1J8_9PLEO|nr:uncharacterized protein PTRG_08618 [Pyrenophora tritici-repentis Pt-1C-BFP]KAA8615428.1 Ifi-6-16 multi-domain protein [Pyrenophora tritici-repentis]EDU51537.1 predicted protein [Pyrenophora tritici-repentis Pt-1C-BFP]KAF7443996.1 Ifi-6-16 multi-domain protein [Pyrenophora tritici-repentis]KAF7566282.1 Ifi-6-16 multi-domain protein [Pyrenophora tritici-repentis]KAG9379731.1 Ifi-6-16 multi-domain protein [Pyrenophora tritici-repentis]